MFNTTLETSPATFSSCNETSAPVAATSALHARSAECRHQDEPGRRLYPVTWAPQLVCDACLSAAAAAHRAPAPSNDNDRPTVNVGAGERRPTLADYDRSARWRAGLAGDGFTSVLDPEPDGSRPRVRRGRRW